MLDGMGASRSAYFLLAGDDPSVVCNSVRHRAIAQGLTW
jgi:hypothetical protein